MICPRCRATLTTVVRDTPSDRIELDACPSCHGVWFDRDELSAALQLENVTAFGTDSPLLEGDRVSLPCPRNPRVSMHERHLAVPPDKGAPDLKIDQCAECGGIWLDGGELPQTIAAMQSKAVRPFLENPETARMGGKALWLFMFFTGLPIEQWNPRTRRPILMPLFVIASVLAFFWQISGGAESMLASVESYGLVPAKLFAGAWPTLFTYMFLHGSWAHLLGNMYFLWVFGDNVEERIGRARFVLLYVVAGIAAGLCNALIASDKMAPVVGASGAISGVMAAYAVLFPRRQLVSLILFFRVRWRASVYLFGWLGFQILGAVMNQRGIAWWAHIGGFVIGALIAWRFRPASLTAPSSITTSRA